MEAHACNHSYLGGRDKRTATSSIVQAKVEARFYLKNKIKTK
jgi:hypothetical protein